MKSHMRSCVAVLTLAGCASGGLAQPYGGGSCQGSVLLCPSFSSPVSVPGTPPAWTPDRRPVWVVGFFPGGDDNSNDLAHYDYWPFGTEIGADPSDYNEATAQESVDNLIERLDDGYDKGFRRFMLHRPAGTVNGKISMTAWWTFSSTFRSILTTDLGDWLSNHPDATFGLYVGNTFDRADEECTIAMDDYYRDGVELLDVSDSTDRCAMYRNLNPWIDAGATEIFFDSAGSYLGQDIDAPPSDCDAGAAAAWNEFASLREFLVQDEYDGVKFGIEPFGWYRTSLGSCSSSNNLFPNCEPAAEMNDWYASVSTFEYANTRGFNQKPSTDAGYYSESFGSWSLDADTTEMAVLFSNNLFGGTGSPNRYDQNIDHMYRWVENGWLLWDWSAPNNWVERNIRRIYSLGATAGLDTGVAPTQGVSNVPAGVNIADFDADGDVDECDFQRAVLFMLHAGYPGAIPHPDYAGGLYTWYHGDFDGDNEVIDMYDFPIWYAAWSAYYGGMPPSYTYNPSYTGCTYGRYFAP